MPSPRVRPSASIPLAEVWADIRRVADRLGVPERGVQLVTRLSARVEAVAGRVARPAVRTPVACLSGLDPPVAAGGWIAELVALAGGVDVLAAAANWPRALEPGDLQRAAPDVLILAPTGADLQAALAAARRFMANARGSALPAARCERVYAADGRSCFGRPGPQLAETLEVIAEILHPDAFRFGHEGRLWERLPTGTDR